MFDFASAAQLPANIMFGTSSWNYEGWRGAIYKKDYRNERDFKANSLAEYVNFPWFRTVGVDSFFYAPPSPTILAKYAAQVPANFRWASKVWEEITIPQYAKHARYGKKAGLPNENFLNHQLFIDRVLRPHAQPTIIDHAGPFIFEFQMLGRDLLQNEGEAFLDQLEKFLRQLPKDFMYSVEIRNRQLLTRRYFDILNETGVTHCFNHWTHMPPLIEQMKLAAAAGGLQSAFYIARILTPIGLSYESAVDRFSPYAEIQEPLPQMRHDVVRLARRAVQRKVPVFVLVNNRSEGHAPGTIDAIGRMIVNEMAEGGEQTDAEA